MSSSSPLTQPSEDHTSSTAPRNQTGAELPQEKQTEASQTSQDQITESEGTSNETSKGHETQHRQAESLKESSRGGNRDSEDLQDGSNIASQQISGRTALNNRSVENTLEAQQTQHQKILASRPKEDSKRADASIDTTTQDHSKKPPVRSPSPPSPPPKDEKFRDPSVSPTKPLHLDTRGKSAVHNHDSEDFGQQEKELDEQDDSKSEIQSIMDQFGEGMDAPGMDEIMSPRLEVAGPKFGSPVSHPPRKSSLEPLQSNTLSQNSQEGESGKGNLQSPPPRTSSLSLKSLQNEKFQASDQMPSPSTQSQVFKPPPPDPESDLPFDFHRFLEQLRHRTADPVARFLRSFLSEFGKKQWMVHEQVKIISDFLEFISKKMAQCEVWRVVSDAEFENAKEGMEKLVMNRLYTQTFSPAIPPPQPSLKGRRRGQDPEAPGRRGQHQEDVERDEVLAQKVRIYQWVSEEHLDIPVVGDKGRKFLQLAQQELLKIRSYRAPRDKVICVLNCCKVIFGFLRNQQTDTSADSFVPLLIYTVLQANPEHLVSNVQYILRFRNQDKLSGEAGYYMSSLMGAVQFIENLDRTSLTVSDADFEANVEAAVSAIAERHRASEEASSAASSSRAPNPTTPGHQRRPSPHMHHVSEKSSLAQAEVTPRNSLDAEHVPPRRSTSMRTQTTQLQHQAQAQGVPVPSSHRSGERLGPGDRDRPSSDDDTDPVSGLLRTIRSPLSTIGRMFADDEPHHPALTPQPGTSPARLSPAQAQAQALAQAQQRRGSADARVLSQQAPGGAPPPSTTRPNVQNPSTGHIQQMSRLQAADAAARQASAESEEARKLQAAEHATVVETLKGMFPGLDREVIDDVVVQKRGRVGEAVDACLGLVGEG